MEIALHPAMPTYSGGSGILAGDMIRAAANQELPMVAISAGDTLDQTEFSQATDLP